MYIPSTVHYFIECLSTALFRMQKASSHDEYNYYLNLVKFYLRPLEDFSSDCCSVDLPSFVKKGENGNV